MRLAAGGGELFTVPKDFIKIFDRDLAAAGIAKRDERDRVVDIHALRHIFGAHLNKAGVAPGVAMAAMRHSSVDLTMNIYTARCCWTSALRSSSPFRKLSFKRTARHCRRLGPIVPRYLP